MKQHIPTEHAEQVCLFSLVLIHQKSYPELHLLTAVPNGGVRHKAVAAKLKAEGVRPGYPDLLLDVPRQGFHGLRIEMKRRKASPSAVSKDQREWHDLLRHHGYRVEVCHGWESAWAVICDYLDINTRTSP